MRQKWGRAKYAGSWPSDKPFWTIAAVIVAMIGGAVIGRLNHAWRWTPLQRCYADVYQATGQAEPSARNGTYSVLVVLTRTGSHLALDSDVFERGEHSFWAQRTGRTSRSCEARMAAPALSKCPTLRVAEALDL